MSKLQKLHSAVAEVCPIDGVSVGRWNDRSSWRLDFRKDATDAQKAAAVQVLGAFDVSIDDAPALDLQAQVEIQAQEIARIRSLLSALAQEASA